ncbi:hypothetical protein FA09DRAFT_331114 [Tilletiopsis washingtonensis]|uniref:Uncharacterized protein n=1 Tax=Tilletiopsis washingtonensis TaxID=58919 RepID=A0A316Z8Y3_9BASI|nr:hypothetical protein FA09DRAFT_331114 [Tilletiopsis washingtonensis]PWN96623.1 hypothetical protein FA09DRAFT_331114 [Tilletiopsis washingtonensis]
MPRCGGALTARPCSCAAAAAGGHGNADAAGSSLTHSSGPLLEEAKAQEMRCLRRPCPQKRGAEARAHPSPA